MEGVINDLVAELNKADPAHLRLDVIFKGVSTYYQPMIQGAKRAMLELHASGGTAAPQVSSSDAVAAQAQISMMADDIA